MPSARTPSGKPGSRNATSAVGTSRSKAQPIESSKASRSDSRKPRNGVQALGQAAKTTRQPASPKHQAGLAVRPFASKTVASQAQQAPLRLNSLKNSFGFVSAGIAREKDGQSLTIEIGVGVVWLRATSNGVTQMFPLSPPDVDRITAMMQGAKAFAGELIR